MTRLTRASASSMIRTGIRSGSSQLVTQVVYAQTSHTMTSSSRACSTPVQRLVIDQVVRELGDREHVDQVEEQLHVGHAGARPGRAEQVLGPVLAGAAQHRAIMTRRPPGSRSQPGERGPRDDRDCRAGRCAAGEPRAREIPRPAARTAAARAAGWAPPGVHHQGQRRDHLVPGRPDGHPDGQGVHGDLAIADRIASLGAPRRGPGAAGPGVDRLGVQRSRGPASTCSWTSAGA